MKLSIILPAYNEEKRIGKTLKEYGDYFTNIKKEKAIDFEILVVINNTSDKTKKIVKDYMKKYSEIKFLNFKQGGKGFAIIEGFKDSLTRDNDLIGFVDADMSTSPEEYYKLILGLENYQGIIANRYLKKSIVNPKQKFIRIIASRVFNFLVRFIFLIPYKDTQCGAKVFKRESIEKILPKLGITQWAFDVDLLYNLKKEKLKIKEYPTVWEDREQSKLNLKKTSIQMFFSIIQLRVNRSPFKRLLKPCKPLIKFIWKILK